MYKFIFKTEEEEEFHKWYFGTDYFFSLYLPDQGLTFVREESYAGEIIGQWQLYLDLLSNIFTIKERKSVNNISEALAVTG